MAAIAQISSVHEWQDEWFTMEEELQQFKQSTFSEYQKKMEDFHSSQKKCISAVNQQKKKLKSLKESFVKCSKNANSNDEEKKARELCKKIEEVELKIKEMEKSLPCHAGSFLRLCLGSINVSLYDAKMEYKNNYENLKLKMTVICMVYAVLNLFFLNHRLTDALFHAVLLWYYSTLTLQENILIANGSRIKGWWVIHHYFSILLSGFLLIWPDGTAYQSYRKCFFVFSVYLSFVQLLQFRYQTAVLYRLRALGISRSMDVTREGFHSWMWRGLSFIIPFLFLGYLLQLYNAYFLFKLSQEKSTTEWQVVAVATNFFILFVGNMTTLIYVIKQKLSSRTYSMPKMPCS